MTAARQSLRTEHKHDSCHTVPEYELVMYSRCNKVISGMATVCNDKTTGHIQVQMVTLISGRGLGSFGYSLVDPAFVLDLLMDRKEVLMKFSASFSVCWRVWDFMCIMHYGWISQKHKNISETYFTPKSKEKGKMKIKLIIKNLHHVK